MNITDSMRQKIKLALEQKDENNKPIISKAELARKLGYERTWPNSIINNTIKTMDYETAIKMEEILNIRFITSRLVHKKEFSPIAVQAAELTENDPHFRQIVISYQNAIKQTKYESAMEHLKVAESHEYNEDSTKSTPTPEEIAEHSFKQSLAEEVKKQAETNYRDVK